MEKIPKKAVKISKSLLDSMAPAPQMYRVWDTEIKGFHVRVSPKGLVTFVQRYHNAATAMNYDINLGRYGAMTLAQARLAATKARARALTDKVDLLAEKRQQKRETEERYKLEKRSSQTYLGGFLDKSYLPWAATHFRPKGYYELERVMSKEFKYLLDYKLEEITPHVVDQYLQKTRQKAKHLRPATINRKIVILKAILSKAVLWDFLDKNRLAGYKMLKVDKQPITRVLSESEEVGLRAALEKRQQTQRAERISYNRWAIKRGYDPKPDLEGHFTDHLYPIVLLALNTGMRRGELFNLEWSSVDMLQRQIRVEGQTSKSGQSREIPLNQEAFITLKKWGEQTKQMGLVFPSAVTKKRMDNIDESWRAVVLAAKVKNFRFHDLRHTFASRLVKGGIDLNTVRELMGHATIEMTLRYTHTNKEAKQSAVHLLDKQKPVELINKVRGGNVKKIKTT